MAKEKNNINLEQDSYSDVSYDENFDGTFEGYPPKGQEENTKKTEEKSVETKFQKSEKPRVVNQKPKEAVVKKHVAQSKIEALKEEKEKANEEKEEEREEEKEEVEEKPVKKSKKEQKKEQKKSKKQDEKENEGNEKGFLLVLAILAVLGVVLIIGLTQPFGKKDLAATVYGKEIKISELDKVYDRLSPEIQMFTTKSQILDELITRKLLLRNAEENGITVNDSEVEDQISTILEQSGLGKVEFQTMLEERNMTYEDVQAEIKEFLLLSKLAKDVILKDLIVTDTEIKRYYENNTDLYTIPEQVNASHILICYNDSVRCISNRTKEEAYLLAREIQDKITEDNFEYLAAQYSEDPVSGQMGGNLGFFGRDEMIKPFEDACFSLNSGQISPKPVETEYGFHIIKVYELKTAQALPLSKVEAQIKLVIESQKQKLLLEQYVKDLRNESESKGQVVIYYKEEANN